MKYDKKIKDAIITNLKAIYNIRNSCKDFSNMNFTKFTKEQMIKKLNIISEVCLNTAEIIENTTIEE